MMYASQYVKDPERQASFTQEISLIVKTIEAPYQEGYLHGAKLTSKNELPPAWKRAIQQCAHRDKEQDERTGDALTGDELLDQGLDGTLEAFGMHTEERKQAFKTHLMTYLEAYNVYIPQGRFDQESSSFRRS
ncbi:hypothetical protein KSB_77050 [Ktedonobacter robiniae]|uniref:Uncharacterized protein n=2 Tax=Ktedonobacter robiniae TaxID=2778365 RepID=A0ABQ3V429_9CHLR|nr:hypothetical protein KSB_77050 [Ktedonobacter robiniae]